MNQREKIFTSIYDIVESNIFLNDVLLKYVFNENDDNNAYIKRSVSGILENKILLDYIIDKYSSTKITKLDKKVYIVLLCAIYELLFMSSKAYAVINEYVAIIKKQKTQFHANYVNAILRKISQHENLDSILTDTNISFKTKYSVPNDLYDYLKTNINATIKDKNQLIENIFKYYLNNHYISFRINTSDLINIDYIKKEFEDKNIDFFIYDKSLKLTKLKCLMAQNINDLTHIDSLNNGLISVQDISSIYYIDRLYSLIRDSMPNNIKVLDSCASPGGKSLAFLRAFDDFNIDINSCDKNENKLTKIKQNFNREKKFVICSSSNILVNDASKLNKMFINSFDVVLIDLPCSGLGIISKKPDIKYNFDRNKIDDLLTIQKAILDINKEYVKINAYLCYSTCTITKDENDDMINNFIDNNSNFELVYREQILSSKENLSDGFYFAILKRTS